MSGVRKIARELLSDGEAPDVARRWARAAVADRISRRYCPAPDDGQLPGGRWAGESEERYVMRYQRRSSLWRSLDVIWREAHAPWTLDSTEVER